MGRFLGMRQAHVAPAVTEGITPVLVVGDLSRVGIDNYQRRGGSCTAPAPGGVLQAACLLHNQATSGVRCRLLKVSFCTTNSATGIATVPAFIIPSNAFVTALGIDSVYSLDPARLVSAFSGTQVVPRAGGFPLTASVNCLARWTVGDSIQYEHTFAGDGIVIEPNNVFLMLHPDPTVGSLNANFEWVEEVLS